jgi:hypothetical protein
MSNRKLRMLTTLSVLSMILLAATRTAAPQGDVLDAATDSQNQGKTKMNDGVTRESPFACNVAGLTTEQRLRYQVLAKKLQSTKQEIRELTDGYAIRFPVEASTIQDLAEFISYERLCCPFFDLELVLEREGGPAWLRLRGREGVKEFIRSEFGIQ